VELEIFRERWGRCGCSNLQRRQAWGQWEERLRPGERTRAQTLLNSETAQSEDESNHELSLQSLQLHQKYIDDIITISSYLAKMR
jgi:hypothetical protein